MGAKLLVGRAFKQGVDAEVLAPVLADGGEQAGIPILSAAQSIGNFALKVFRQTSCDGLADVNF